MNNLKQKTVYGLIWNFLERFFNTIVLFVVGVILARILEPSEFGLIGMLAIFISLSQVLINSGLNTAIIRKKSAREIDYATVFVFNIVSSLGFFLLLVALSKPISIFYDEPILKNILILLAFGLVIESFGAIQLAKLQKEMDFKLQTIISLIATTISGTVAIIMALQGYGVWSLVALHLSRILTTTILIWVLVKWKPSLGFDKKSFFEMYSFGSKLLFSGIIDTIYIKGFALLIGKFYSTAQVGFYNQSDRLQSLVSTNISGLITKVSFPLLSQIKDSVVLKNAYKEIIRNIMFISFVLLLGLGATAESLVLALLGEKWHESVIYLQMLVLSGMLLPFQALNTDILKVYGRSDLFLKVVLIKKAIAIPVMLITAFISINAMIIGIVLMSILSYIINVHWSNKYIDYPLQEQLKDVFPSFMIALVNATIIYFIGQYLTTPHWLTLIIQVSLGFVFIVVFCEVTQNSIYKKIKSNLLDVVGGKK